MWTAMWSALKRLAALAVSKPAWAAAAAAVLALLAGAFRLRREQGKRQQVEKENAELKLDAALAESKHREDGPRERIAQAKVKQKAAERRLASADKRRRKAEADLDWIQKQFPKRKK